MVVSLAQRAIAKKRARYYLLEGFPMTINQGVMLESMVGECRLVLNFSGEKAALLHNAMLRGDPKALPSEDGILRQIEEREAAAEPVLNYYEQFAKVRHMDCGAPTEEVYQQVTQAVMPKVHFIVGPKCSGKSVVSSYLAERANMKRIVFSEFAADKKLAGVRKDPVLITQALLKTIMAESSAQMIVDGFPESQKQLETYVANAPAPQDVIFINATEDVCLRNNDAMAKSQVPSTVLMQVVKDFYRNIKGTLELCKKMKVLRELQNSEEIALPKLIESAGELVRPEIILGRCHEKGQELLEAMISDLVNAGGYMHLDVSNLRKEETARRTEVGAEMMQFAAKGKIIPADCTIKMLKRIIYSGSGQQRFVLTGFPEEVEQLKLLEETCARIDWEFYLHPSEESPLSSYSGACIETYMHSTHRLTASSSFNFASMDKYHGEQTQYVLVHGPKLSGKTAVSKMIAERFGYTLLDVASSTEELKKKLATEEVPADSVAVNFDQVLKHMQDRMSGRKNRKEKFVVDVFPLENPETLPTVLNAFGPPTRYLELDFPLDYVKARYKVVNTLDSLAEDQAAELDKGYAAYEATKKELEQLRADKEIVYCEVKTTVTLDKVQQKVEAIFAPRLVLIKHDSVNPIDTIMCNLSIRYNFLYLNVAALIKQAIAEDSKTGRELRERRKLKALATEYAACPDEAKFCAVHYDYPLVLRLVKETVERLRTDQTYIVVLGLINSQKLLMKEDQLGDRAMDELFAVEKELGAINSILNITKGDYDSTEDVRKSEFLEKPPEKVEVKKELKEGEEPEPEPEPEPDEEGMIKTTLDREGEEGGVQSAGLLLDPHRGHPQDFGPACH